MSELINTILTGNARELAAEVADESVDLIFTDPVYERPEDYLWLAQTAMRVLKPNRACLAWTSSIRADSSKSLMELAGLTWQCNLNYVIPAKACALHHYGVFLWNTQCLYFAKGHFKASPYIPDTFISQLPPQNGFAWQKNLGVIERWMESLSKPDDVVFDPFTGTGSVPIVCQRLGRRYIAFEVNPERAEDARQRVAMAPPRLPFVGQAEQQTFESDVELTA